MDIEQALLNTVLAWKLMCYSYSLKSFFKDEFKEMVGIKSHFRTYFILKEMFFNLSEMHVILFVQTTIINVRDTE